MEKRVVQNPLDNAEDLITRATRIVNNRAVQSIARDPKTGKTYGNHTASAAGEPPATDRGFLVGSITFKVDRTSEEVVGTVSVSAPYAPHLEFGTTNMAARPFLHPALEQNRDKIKKMFKEGGLIK